MTYYYDIYHHVVVTGDEQTHYHHMVVIGDKQTKISLGSMTFSNNFIN